MAASIKPKSVVLSAGIFAIVATGAVMGARLKSEQEYKAVSVVLSSSSLRFHRSLTPVCSTRP